MLDRFESLVHSLYGSAVHAIANARQRALEDKAVAMARLIKEQNRILDRIRRFEAAVARLVAMIHAKMEREESALVADFRKLEAKVAKAEAARANVESFLKNL